MKSKKSICWDEESFELLDDWEDACEEETCSFCRLGDDCSNTYDDNGTRDDDISLSRSSTANRTVAESYTLHTLWIADLRTVECVSLQQVIPESVVDNTKPSEGYFLPEAVEVFDEPTIERVGHALVEAEVLKTNPQVASRQAVEVFDEPPIERVGHALLVEAEVLKTNPQVALRQAVEVFEEPPIKRVGHALLVEAEVLKTNPQVALRRIRAGRCAFCGIQTHTNSGFCAALTIEGRVLHGHCLACFPIDNNCLTLESQSAEAWRSGSNDGYSGSPAAKPFPSPSGSALSTSYAQELSDLQARKRELKQQLKQHDMNFVRKLGRKPLKAEKEPIRHLYENYNSLKSQIALLEQEGRQMVSPVSIQQPAAAVLPQRTVSSVSSGPDTNPCRLLSVEEEDSWISIIHPNSSV
jgi:hypothetical protein